MELLVAPSFLVDQLAIANRTNTQLEERGRVRHYSAPVNIRRSAVRPRPPDWLSIDDATDGLSDPSRRGAEVPCNCSIRVSISPTRSSRVANATLVLPIDDR